MKKCVIFMLFLLMMPIVVFAEECSPDGISLKSVELSEKSGNAEEVNSASIDAGKINLNLKLSEVGDYVQYKIVVKNTTDLDYELSPSNLGGDSEYVKYEFVDVGGSKVLKAGESRTVQLRVSYNKEVPDSILEYGKYSDSKELVLSMTGEGKTKNPITGYSSLITIMLILLISSVLSIIALKNVKLNKSIMLFILAILIPISVSALCKYDIKVSSNVEIEKKDYYVYTFNDMDNPCQIGQAIPDNVQVYNSAQETGKVVFLRHKIVNGIIVESSVGFKFNGGEHYITGAGATEGVDEFGYVIYNPDSIYFEENKQKVVSLFGNDKCYEGLDYYYCNYYRSFRAHIYKNGNVSFSLGCSDDMCSVSEDGSSSCGITYC